MGEFIAYSVKVSLCLVMFYVFYKLLLSRTTLHTFNRFVILVLVAMSLVLPFVHITMEKPAIEGTVTIDRLLMMATVAGEQEEPEFHLSAISIAVLIYIIGVCGFLINMVLSYIGIYRIMRQARMVVDDDGARIYVVDEDIAPFSWFSNIVISAADYRDNHRAIITHEKAHVARGHSADIMLCNILTVVQWFNPAAWLLKSELQDVHEYEADEAVLCSGIDATGYQLLLVRKAVGDRLFAIANNLNKDSLKKRITMMKTKRTNRWAGMKALVVLPLAAIAVVAFANPEVAEVENKVVAESQQLMQAVERQVTEQPEAAATPAPVAKEMVETEAAPAEPKDDDEVFDIVDELPQYPGGTGEMMKFLVVNIRYPKEAEKQNAQGRVIVSFVVTKTGEITKAKIVRSVHPQLDAEALRMVNAMPKWIPGKNKGKPVDVKYVIPVQFRLDDGTKKTDQETPAATDKEEPAQNEAPLVVVNGYKSSKESLEAIDPNNIEHMTVLKNENAVKQFGDEGKNGVILVTTKQKK